MEFSVFHIFRAILTLSDSVKRPSVRPVVEAALRIEMASYALG